MRFCAKCPIVTIAIVAAACAAPEGPGETPSLPEPISEHAEIELPAPGSEGEQPQSDQKGVVRQDWSESTHVNISELAAEKWWLPSSRTSTIGNAGDDPDDYEGGFDDGFNQQWSHAYLYSAFGFWMWGDANENFDDCITGSVGGECKDGKSAAHYYAAGNQQVGDTYLGYAIHYVEDVSVVTHSSDPTLAVDLLFYHFSFEDWVKNNWSAGHDFQATVAADNYYYPIDDLQEAVRSAAWASSYWNSASYGRRAWNAYHESGYPTGAGTGNAELVLSTKQMLIRASRYATGAIKYALDTYDQWDAEY